MSKLFGLCVLVSVLVGCATTVPPNDDTEVFVGYYDNKVTDIHRDANYHEGLVGNIKVSGIVEDGKWLELERKVMPWMDAAEIGQTLDAVTTVYGLSQGFSEANPLGVATLPAKYIINDWAEEQPNCTEYKKWLSAFGYGSAAANIVTIGSVGFTAASAGAGLLAGAAAYHYLPGDNGCAGWLVPRVRM